LVRVLEGLLRDHADGTPAGLDLLQERVVTQARRHGVVIDVIADELLERVAPERLIILPVGVLRVSLEVQEVGTDGTIAVLETGEDDPVLHLCHRGADQNGQSIGGGAAPGGIPGAPHAFTDCARLEDVRRAARRHDDRFRAEYVKMPGTDIEADGACNALAPLVHQQVGHHDPVIDFGSGLACSLGDDGLVALAVDHDLPFAFALISPVLRVSHDRQAPLLELVHRGVDMPRNVVAQILTHQPHQVVPRVADMIFELIFVPLHAHVAVYSIKPLRDGSAPLDVRLLDAYDLQITAPVPGFVSSPTPG